MIGVEYERDGAEIYRRSFATIRAEADLAGLPADVAQVAVRMIHACGMVDLVADIGLVAGRRSRTPARRCRPARRSCATRAMVAAGVTRKRLPADNEVVCTLRDPRRRRRWPSSSAPPAARRRWSCGGTGWTVRSSRSATRRPRCSGCSRWSRRARRGRPRCSASRSASSARPSPRRRWPRTTRPGVPGRARPARRQRDHRRRGQRDRERGRVMRRVARLWGVGLGPGDPELVTVKAARLIGAARRGRVPQRPARPQHRPRRSPRRTCATGRSRSPWSTR